MRRKSIACSVAVLSALALPSAASAADAIHAITDGNRLLRFNSDAPGQLTGNVPVSGLAQGETVVGLDVRPSDDQLFAVTSANRAVQVNPVTGITRPAFGPFDPALNGAAFGVDFNPVANALRIVSDTDQNLRVTASNQTNNDGQLQYAAGDPGAGTNPSVTAAAYSNSTPDATSTVLFDIDTARDVLVRQDPANAGTLTTVGALGADYDQAIGFDIAPGGTAYALLRRSGQQAVALYRIDLNSGAAAAVERGTITTPDGAGAIRGIAVAGAVPDDTTRPEMSVAFSSTILEQNTNVLEPSISCDETCTVTVRAEVQGRAAGQATETIQGAGRATVQVRLNAPARRRIARQGTELISLDIAAVDAAGNTDSQNNRVSRTQTLAARRGN